MRAVRHTVRLLFFLVALCLAAPAMAQPVVECYDAKHQLVSRTMAGRCDGVVVSEQEAAEIRARRIGRVQTAIQHSETPLVPDRRLTSIGTGFFVTAQGHLVTNNHVIDECAVLTVEATNGENARADLLAAEPRIDLAIVKTSLPPPAVAAFRPPGPLAAGSRADLVGYPTQGVAPITPFFTKGDILEPAGRPPNAARFMIRGDVRGGNSGGPVLDLSGAVIGVIFAEPNTPKIFKETGQVVKDIGYAIRNAVVLDFLDRHGVAWRSEAGGASLTREQAFDAAKPFVARIGCWR
jgi:S1-C subfamily serine protease